MLACVCLNPSFDRTVSLCSFTAGDVNRVLSARQDDHMVFMEEGYDQEALPDGQILQRDP